MPCVACLRGHPSGAVPLRTLSLRSVVWGPSKPRLRRTTPRSAWAPYGRPGGGLAALPHLATSTHPPSLHSAALHFGRSDAPSCHCPPLVGLASARLSPQPHPSLPPFGRSVRLCPGSTRSPPYTSLRSVPVGPRLRLKAKPAERGVVRLFEASTAGATPPAHGRALGRPKTDDGGGRFAPCALPSVGHRLSVFPWRLPPSLGVPSGAPHEAAARRSLRSLCLAPPSSWLSLPAVARPCRGGSLKASLRFAAIRPRSLRPRAAMPQVGRRSPDNHGRSQAGKVIPHRITFSIRQLPPTALRITAKEKGRPPASLRSPAAPIGRASRASAGDCRARPPRHPATQ